jgi:hypothetical protein
VKKAYKTLLVYFVEIVGFLFTAFGGFLTKIAPPEQSGAPFIVGISSFLALISLLVVAAVAKSASGLRFRRRWIVAGLVAAAFALPAAYFYSQSLNRYTWSYPADKPVQRLRGSSNDFSQSVKDFLDKNPSETDPKRLARSFEIDQIWTAGSVERAGNILSLQYAWLVLSLATAVFCLVEANSQSDAEDSKSSGSNTDGDNSKSDPSHDEDPVNGESSQPTELGADGKIG